MQRRNQKIITIVLTAAMILTMGSGVNFQSVHAADTELRDPVVEMNTCDTIYFGNYWQEDTNGDGVADQKDDKTPIRWRILSRYGNDAYVMADQVLDCKPYHEKNENVTWETCTLRKWLNEEFFNAAFTSAEQEAVLEQTLVNEDNEEYGTDGGEDTVDRVYLPSMTDIKNEEYGFSESYSFSDQARIGKATSYAEEQGTYVNGERGSDWWLRSSGRRTSNASVVFNGGWGYFDGRIVSYNSNAVRPALHLDLSSPLVQQGDQREISLGHATWDLVELGTYAGKAITWRVLSISGNDVFLLSDQVLADRKYHEKKEEIIWRDSTLRAWLNGEFYQEAFTDEEKAGIRPHLYENEDNPWYGTEGGEDTTDSISLLSLEDIINPAYGFPTDYTCGHQGRRAGDRTWWLRSPGRYTTNAFDVVYSGWDNIYGHDVDDDDIAVRPVLYFDLSVHPLTKIGTVTAEAEEDSAPAATTKPSNQPNFTPVPTDPGKYKSVINYIDLGEVSYFGEEADETDVVPTNAEVTGPGTYHVALDFTQTKQGAGNGITFMGVQVRDLAEYYHPDRYIRLDEIKINGEKVSDQILRRAYTCTDNGIFTQVNLYNQWCPEDDALNREDARSLGNIQEATPYLLEDYIEDEIARIEVTFTYGTKEEISKIDQDPAVSPSLPVQSPTSRPKTSEKPDRTPTVNHTPKPKDTPFPEDTLEPKYTPEPEETQKPKHTSEPEGTKEPKYTPEPKETKLPDKNDDNDLTDDQPNRNLTVKGLDIATGNVVKKGFLTLPQVQLTWDANRNCDGYEIWRKAGNSSFVKVDYIDDSDETEWFDTNLKKGYKYTYQVLGYREEDDGTVSRAGDSNSVSVKIRQTVKSCTYTAKRTGKKLKIIFKKAEGTKYQIQVKYGKSQKWKKASGSLKKKIVKKVSPKKLKVRIRTGEKVNGKMKYCKWSKVKTVR